METLAARSRRRLEIDWITVSMVCRSTAEMPQLTVNSLSAVSGSSSSQHVSPPRPTSVHEVAADKLGREMQVVAAHGLRAGAKPFRLDDLRNPARMVLLAREE